MAATLAPTTAPTGAHTAADEAGPALRDQVGLAGRSLERVLATAKDDVDGSRGTVAALLDLLEVVETAQAAAIELTGRIQRDGLAERTMGMPLEGLLAFRSKLTHGDRRTLTGLADLLGVMPHLRAAVHAGAVGFAALRAIAVEARVLNRDQLARLDAGFADHDQLRRLDPDRLVDGVRDAVSRLRPDLAEQREVRRIEGRFLHLQPAFDGALTLYGELDPEAGSTVLSALDAAAGRPTGDADVTRGAADDGDVDEDARTLPRSRARQRADALTVLAETFLGGARPDGTPRRARPRLLIWAELDTLLGTDPTAQAARLLWDLHGGPVALTPAAARRLASDATWQFVLHDHGEVLGVTAPTDAIPARVRVAVAARDQGCRFPGCSAPVGWCDLHHVVPREDHGPTTVDNLVALCRRHHTAVTEGRWRLTMSRDGTVTVRRGRHVHTSDPPHRQCLDLGPAPEGSSGGSGSSRPRAGPDPPRACPR